LKAASPSHEFFQVMWSSRNSTRVKKSWRLRQVWALGLQCGSNAVCKLPEELLSSCGIGGENLNRPTHIVAHGMNRASGSLNVKVESKCYSMGNAAWQL
jgi:hypothetical protein